jgi:hypothetical protein
MSESPIEPLALGPGEGLAVRNPVGGILTFFLTYAGFPAHERGAEAFARLANETQALEILGPPLAQSDPI